LRDQKKEEEEEERKRNLITRSIVAMSQKKKLPLFVLFSLQRFNITAGKVPRRI
jgi:hypothetical protein